VNNADLRLLEPEDKLLVSYDETPQSLHTYSNGTKADGVTADLVDVGAGTKEADYEGKNVEGRFVLATGRAKSVHEYAVFKHGAAGVITDSVTLEIPGVRESLDIPDAHAYQSIWPTAKNLDKVTFGFSISKRQGNQLRALLKRGKTVKLKAHVDAQLFPGSLEVVTATIPGESRTNEEVFLVAHLCHPKPSANDNASGSGLLIEIARTINSLINSGRIRRPIRTIRFLWVPETRGSVCYLYNHEDVPNRFMAGINLDMVGENQEVCKSTLNLDRTPDSLPSYLNDLVFHCIQESVETFDMQSPFGSTSTFRYATGSFSGGSDHAEFTDSTIKVPCVMLLQWPDMFYHTSMDTLDKVSEDSLRRIGWITANAILTIANATFETAFQLANETASAGIIRIEEVVKEAQARLFSVTRKIQFENKSIELAEELTRSALYYKSKLEHSGWREQEAVKSVQRLAEDSKLDCVNELCNNIANLVRHETERIQETVNVLAESLGLTIPSSYQPAESNRNRVIPKRLFKGTLDSNVLRETLDEKELGWYEKVREKDINFDKKTAEALNFMDGKRTFSQVMKAVSAEYGETDSEHLFKFLKDLERIRLVQFSEPKC
jgi:hypothetical protein